MNIELALQFGTEMLPTNLHMIPLRGHAHLWTGIPFQGVLLHTLQMASHLIGAKKETELLLFKKGNHPDVLYFADDGEKLKVEDAKKIVEKVALSPQGGTHIVIIENIERMTEEAANMLLKTIEEPGSSVYFLCSTEHCEKVLPTLISRMTVHNTSPHTYTEIELQKAIAHWQLPWQVESLTRILPRGEGIFYRMIEEHILDKSFALYDFLFELQSTYTNLLSPKTNFYTAAQSLSFLYDKKELDNTNTALFFFTFEAYLAKLVMNYVTRNDQSALVYVRRLQKGLTQLKNDISANVHKKLATHHFILSSVV